MDISLRNIPGTTTQQAVVTVHRDGEDDVGPTISYIIEHDSVTIEQNTADDRIVGHGVLSLRDIDVLTNNSPTVEAVNSLAERISEKASPAGELLTGKIAFDMFKTLLESMCHSAAPGPVSVLQPRTGPWSQIPAEAARPEALRDAEMVVLDGGSAARWKYTYFPKQETGLYLRESTS